MTYLELKYLLLGVVKGFGIHINLSDIIRIGISDVVLSREERGTCNRIQPQSLSSGGAKLPQAQ